MSAAGVHITIASTAASFYLGICMNLRGMNLDLYQDITGKYRILHQQKQHGYAAFSVDFIETIEFHRDILK